MLTFYTYIPHRASASFYYRLMVPFQTARDLGLPVRVHVDTNDSTIDQETRIRIFCEADVIKLYHPIGEPTLHNARIAKSIIPSKRDGQWKHPPTLIVETDDNIFNVSPYNDAYRHLGCRDHLGNELPSGHLIGDVRDGQRHVLWKDGEQGFDIARNRQTLMTYRGMLEMADAVSCSTRYIAETVRSESKARRVEVFPNLVRFDHYEQVKLAPDPERLLILWQGGASHYEDWYPLREALGEITRRYKHVHWLIWGQLYPWATELIPADRFTFINWCAYEEYKLRLVMMGHQISLAPLYDSRFNRGRSAIKFYEASVLRQPAATLAQATGPYAEEIVDRETGLLFSTPAEFVERLSTLIENETLRRSLAANAKDWVSEHRDAFKHVPKQMAWIEDLRERTKREQPHMSEADWVEFEAKAKAQEPEPQAVA